MNNQKKLPRIKASAFLLLLICTACAPASPADTTDPETGTVIVSHAELLIMESNLVQVALAVSGDLPTPCHDLMSDVVGPDEEANIQVTVSSRSGDSEACLQVLEPFSEQIPIEMLGADEGYYSVWLNGDWVGDFSYPG